MAANTQPIYVKAPDIQWGSTDGNGGAAGPLKTANTAKDGTGTVLTVFTADATNGGVADRLVARPAGTNIASVLRVFLNNGATNATPANNVLVRELFLPVVTLNEAQQFPDIVLPLNMKLPAGYKLNVVLGTTIAGGVYVSVEGGKY